MRNVQRNCVIRCAATVKVVLFEGEDGIEESRQCAFETLHESTLAKHHKASHRGLRYVGECAHESHTHAFNIFSGDVPHQAPAMVAS